MPPLTEQLEPEVPLDETNGNKQSVLIRKRKISKTSAESDASSTQPKAQKFKYCNASTVSWVRLLLFEHICAVQSHEPRQLIIFSRSLNGNSTT
jgi:hypothetical protein